jgi:hypothetical protein
VESAVPGSGGGEAQENKLLFSRALAALQCCTGGALIQKHEVD